MGIKYRTDWLIRLMTIKSYYISVCIIIIIIIINAQIKQRTTNLLSIIPKLDNLRLNYYN